MLLLSVLPAWFILGLFAMLGLALGSFGNVLIARLPAEKSIGGRSVCPRCGKILTWKELIPVVSYAWLKGRCRGCKERISMQYALVEAASCALFVAAALLFPGDLIAALCASVGLWAMLLIAVIDARTQTIPDILTIVAGAAGLLLQLHLGTVGIAAPLVGGLFFGAQWLMSGGRWVGSGDIFLAISMGLLLGTWQHMLVALTAAYIIGAAWVLWLLFRHQVNVGQSVAFGQFLVLGTFIAFIGGERILMVMGF